MGSIKAVIYHCRCCEGTLVTKVDTDQEQRGVAAWAATHIDPHPCLMLVRAPDLLSLLGLAPVTYAWVPVPPPSRRSSGA